jgi:hypothetical protein
MRRWILGFVTCAVVGLQVAWLVRTPLAPRNVTPGDGSPEAAAATMVPNLDLTSPQYARLQEASRIAGSLETFESAAAALDVTLTSAQSALLSYAGQTGGGHFPDRTFAAALADNRMARMYELLKPMPLDDAREKLRTLFQRKLDDWSAFWIKLAPLYDQLPSNPSSRDLQIHYRAIAICVVLAGALLPKDEAAGWCLE